MNFYRKYGKRIFDLCLAVPAFIVLSPIMAVVSLLVAVKLGRPVLFTQLRPGYHEKIFKMYKFRSMTDERDQNGQLLPDEKRLTPFGKWLRSTSLDELPELLNILKGDMSLVGPRPQLIRDMVFMTKEQRRRHMVPQGLTGLAQVNGRNNISWEKKLAYDQKYVKNITFLGDLLILFRTVFHVMKKEDVNTVGMATAEDYGDYLLRTGKVDKKNYDRKQKIAQKICEKYGRKA